MLCLLISPYGLVGKPPSIVPCKDQRVGIYGNHNEGAERAIRKSLNPCNPQLGRQVRSPVVIWCWRNENSEWDSVLQFQVVQCRTHSPRGPGAKAVLSHLCVFPILGCCGCWNSLRASQSFRSLSWPTRGQLQNQELPWMTTALYATNKPLLFLAPPLVCSLCWGLWRGFASVFLHGAPYIHPVQSLGKISVSWLRDCRGWENPCQHVFLKN